MPRFLCHLVHTDDRSYVDFRVSELEAVAGMVGASIEFDRAAAADLSQPFLWVSLPSEEAAEAIAKRATQVRAFYDVYAFCDNLSPDECIEQAAAEAERRKQAGEGSEFRDTFRLCVDYFGRRCSSELRMKLIEKMATTLPFEGAVDLKNAKRVFKLIVDLGHNAGLVELDEDGKKRKKHLSLDKLTPRQVFFVRVVAEGTGRQDVQQYSLKKRGYIGPTSTDAELAAIMSNMAQVKRGDLVMDMFVGTGSLLVAAAAQGAVCLGQDIDIRVLYGSALQARSEQQKKKWASLAKKKAAQGQTIRDNFAAYELPPPELVRADNATPSWVDAPFLDAIVTDPPYGIRAGARRTGSSKTAQEVPEEHLETHIPRTQAYAVNDVMRDMLTFSAKRLRLGGRLVFLYPTTTSYTEAETPRHPCFQVVADSEQRMQGCFRRRCITMVKVKAFEDTDRPAIDETALERLREAVYAMHDAERRKERLKMSRRQWKQLQKEKDRSRQEEHEQLNEKRRKTSAGASKSPER